MPVVRALVDWKWSTGQQRRRRVTIMGPEIFNPERADDNYEGEGVDLASPVFLDDPTDVDFDDEIEE